MSEIYEVMEIAQESEHGTKIGTGQYQLTRRSDACAPYGLCNHTDHLTREQAETCPDAIDMLPEDIKLKRDDLSVFHFQEAVRLFKRAHPTGYIRVTVETKTFDDYDKSFYGDDEV